MSFQKEIDQAIKDKRLYFVGDSLPTDWYAGFKDWLQAAEAGDAKAQYNVGRCYCRGDGVDKDEDQAKYWYTKAKEQNDPRAFFNLHLLHEDKASKYRDDTLAEEFLNEAARLGEERAVTELKKRKTSSVRSDFEVVNAAAEEKLVKLLRSKNIDGARKFLESINDERIVWLKEYLPYFDLEVDPKYKVVSEKFKDETWVEGGIVNGTTSWFKKVESEKRYYAIVNVRNNSDKECYGIPAGQTKTFEWLDGRSGFSAGLNAHKHPYDVLMANGKCDPYKPFDSYYWMEIDSVFCWYKKNNGIYIPFKEPVVVPQTEKHQYSISGCFVLTACYGDENHPVVQGFREFRDGHLMKTKFGQAFIDCYYKYGPLAAKAVEKKRLTKAVLRQIFCVINWILPKRS